MTKDEIAKMRADVTEKLNILCDESIVDFYLAVKDSMFGANDFPFYCGINHFYPGLGLTKTVEWCPELKDYIDKDDPFEEDEEAIHTGEKQ